MVSLCLELCVSLIFFFFNDTATTEIYTLSLHDALPIYDHQVAVRGQPDGVRDGRAAAAARRPRPRPAQRSEEHTSELQSRQYLVCRLLLEKKKKRTIYLTIVDIAFHFTIYAFTQTLYHT